MRVQWGTVCRPKQGQSVSGDTYVIRDFGEHFLLAAVIDGLGGGHEAARASEGAAEVLQKHPDYALKDLMRQAHDAIQGTRGAVIAALRFDLNLRHIDYIGVGNIGVQVYSQQPIKPISKNGIVGYRLPSLLQLHYSYNAGDTFILYSDGISSQFGLDGTIDSSLSPQTLADTILAKYGKTIDDATIVVIRTT